MVHAGPLVLIVEDDESIRQFLELTLNDEGYRVVSATNGARALDLLAELQPDLILLDMRMPVMDGATFVQSYRERSGPLAPVILLTAAREVEIETVGPFVDAVLAKPFHIEELLNLITAQLGRQ